MTGDLQVVDGSGDAPAADLFRSEAFFALHAGEESQFFSLQVRGRVRGSVHFTHVGDGLWRSPGRGTYAGWAWAPDVRPEELAGFVEEVERRLAARGARSLEALPPPMAHDPGAYARIVYVLHAAGWSTARYDLNQSIEVDHRPLEQRMSSGNRGYLRKAARDGIWTGPLPLEDLAEAHQVQVDNKAAKGRAFSMDLAQLRQMQQAFPDDVLLFGSRTGGQLAAAAICLRLSTDVVYVFSWGHRPEFSASSPVVALASSIYRYCQDQGIGVLDIGTSTTDRDADHGLLHFKRGLGCTESLKIRLTKRLGASTTRA